MKITIFKIIYLIPQTTSDLKIPVYFNNIVTLAGLVCKAENSFGNPLSTL